MVKTDIPGIIKAFKLKLTFILLVTLFAGCTKEGAEGDKPGENNGNVVITFKGASADGTRSSLNGMAVDYSNVKNVFLLIFNGSGPDATLSHTEDVVWEENPAQEYRLQKVLDPGTYTIVGVGTDEVAKVTYGLETAKFNVPLTLSEAVAKLQDGYGKEQMAHSDFYVGMSEITILPAAINRAEITMKRMESGVIVYLKNIPYEIRDLNNTAYSVDEVWLDLYQEQHTTLQLVPEGGVKPFGSGILPESKRLLTFDMSAYEKSVENGHYIIPAQTGATLNTLPNTIYGGVFLLPVAAESGKATLTITLHHKANEDLGTGIIDKEYSMVYPVNLLSETGTKSTDYDILSNHVYCIGRKPSGANTDGDQPLDMLGNLIEITADQYEFNENIDVNFPSLVIPGYIAGDFSSEFIFDCMNCFEDILIEPSYPNKGWTLLLPDGCDWISLGYFEDSARTNFIKLNTDGKLVTDLQAKEAGLLVDGNKANITLFIHDYVKWPNKNEAEWADKWPEGALAQEFPELTIQQKKEFLAKDFRQADLELLIDGLKPSILTIRQYNAVPIRDLNHKNFGISRVDFNHWFSRDKSAPAGLVVRPTDKRDLMSWGFGSTNVLHIFGSDIRSHFNYDGLENLHHAYEKRRDKSSYFKDAIWFDSILQITCGDCSENYNAPEGSPKNFNNPPYNSPATNNGVDRLYRSGSSYEEIAKYKAWFVPAEKQLDAIAAAMGNDNGLRDFLNFSPAKYWSLTTDIAGDGVWAADAYAYDFSAWKGKDEDRNKDWSQDPDNKFYARLARFY